jgi:hypothetical protein
MRYWGALKGARNSFHHREEHLCGESYVSVYASKHGLRGFGAQLDWQPTVLASSSVFYQHLASRAADCLLSGSLGAYREDFQ